MKKLLFSLLIVSFLLASPLIAGKETEQSPQGQTQAQPIAYDPSFYVLMAPGGFMNLLLLKAMPRFQEYSIRKQLGIGFLYMVSRSLAEYAPELVRRYFNTEESSESRKRLLQAIREVSPQEALLFSQMFFNDDTLLEINAVFARTRAAANKDQPLSTILLYGPPGTGKTEVAKSFVHMGFQVFLVPSHIIRDEIMFRETIVDIERRKANKKRAIIVDDAEFFFSALGPTNAGLRTNSREELESSFRTSLGSDSIDTLWIFTSNKVGDLENDTTGAVKRRFKNKILVPLPNPKTRENMLRTLIETSSTRFGFGQSIEDGFYDEPSLSQFRTLTEEMSQDQLKQVIDNAIFLAQERTEAPFLRMADILFFAGRSHFSDGWMKEQATKEIENELRILKRQVEVKELRKLLQDQQNEKEETPKQKSPHP